MTFNLPFTVYLTDVQHKALLDRFGTNEPADSAWHWHYNTDDPLVNVERAEWEAAEEEIAKRLKESSALILMSDREASLVRIVLAQLCDPSTYPEYSKQVKKSLSKLEAHIFNNVYGDSE